MKTIYNRFRIALMAFALGLAGVYMSERIPSLSGEVHVDLPTAASADVLPVFIDNSLVLTREKNCGKDPADPQARLECTNERLFGNRDMSLYARYEIASSKPTTMLRSSESDMEMRESAEDRMQRSVIWRHWKGKTRAHIVVNYVGNNWISRRHYFIERSSDGSWQLSATDERPMWLFVDGEGTDVTFVEPHRSYKQARWKISSRDDSPYPYSLAPGTRYLEFENEIGQSVSF